MAGGTGRQPAKLETSPTITKSVARSCDSGSITVTGAVNGHRQRLLVDTGSNKTIVRSDLLEAKEILETQVDLCGVTGHRIPLRGPVDVELQVGAASMRHSVYVADVADPCILGLDFLNKYHCSIDIPNLTMEAAGVQVNLQMQDESDVSSYRNTTTTFVTLLDLDREGEGEGLQLREDGGERVRGRLGHQERQGHGGGPADDGG